MVIKFRHYYPQGSLISELVTIKRGQYIVRVLAQVEGVTLSTGLAAASTVEQAEDRARERAMALLDFDNPSKSAPVEVKETVKPSTTAFQPNLKVTPLEKEPFLEQQSLPSPPSTPKPIPEKPEPVAALASPSLAAPSASPNPSLEPSSSPSLIELTPLPEPPVSSSVIEEPPVNLAESTSPANHETIDFTDVIAKTNIEMNRLSWTKDQGREYLLQTYGKRSRQLLTDEEVLEFLHYLEKQPTP